VAAVFVTETAAKDLKDLIAEHSLPADTPMRVRKLLRHLTRFPLMGSPLEGRWEGSRFLLGPWRWMLIVYEYVADQDAVFVTTIQDSRRAASATSGVPA
jgi:mRNA-degrading endonuclease RelE of RelBE toxin-antitoxin system